MNANESFERFGTMAFGQELMMILIKPWAPGPCLACGNPSCLGESRRGAARVGDMDARAWFLLVPQHYRAEVQRLTYEASRPFVGHKLDSWMAKVYVGALHAAIVTGLTPSRPSACDDAGPAALPDAGKVWQ